MVKEIDNENADREERYKGNLLVCIFGKKDKWDTDKRGDKERKERQFDADHRTAIPPVSRQWYFLRYIIVVAMCGIHRIGAASFSAPLLLSLQGHVRQSP